MPVGDMPILELLVRSLANVGITEVTLAVGHLASLIQAYFGDGSQFGSSIDYSMESEPLGTAGPLRLIEGLDDRFLVTNGDLLTDLDFKAFIDSHIASGAPRRRSERTTETSRLTSESSKRTIHRRIVRYLEKPVHRFQVSMGVYIFEPEVLEFISPGRFDLPNLIENLLVAGRPVHSYLHTGYWLDIGHRTITK